jgi:hypothetical protein
MTKRYQRSLYCMSSDIRLLFTSLVSLWSLHFLSSDNTTSVYLFGENTMTNRYQRGKQKSNIRGHTIQWPRDTKQVNRSHKPEDRHFCPLIIRLLFTSLVSLGHCIVCPLIYDFCLHLWNLLVIVLSVLYLRVMFTSLERGKHKS